MRTGLCRPSKRRDRCSRPRHQVRKCASQTPILRKNVEELESTTNGYSEPIEDGGTQVEDWEQNIRSSIRSRDRRSLNVWAVSMGAPHRDKATQIIIEEVIATSGRAALTSFCGLLREISRFPRDSLHVISVIEIWRGVKAWFQEQDPNIAQWNRVMKVLCSHRSDESLEEAEEILTSLEASDSLQPDAATYTSYLWALGRKIAPASSLAILYRMLNNNVEPDGECYQALMTVYAKDKTGIGMDTAKMWLQKADMAFRRQYARKQNLLNRRIVSLYSDLIVGCAISGRLQDAYTIIGMLQVRGLVPSTRTFYLLLRATMALDAQGLDLCRDLLRTMTRMGIVPDARHYNQVILGYGAQGMVSDAFRLADRMQRSGIAWDQDTYYYLIITVLKGSREEEVAICRQLLGKMRRQGVPPQQRHYIVSLQGLGTAGFIADAENLFGKLRSLGTTEMAYHAMMKAHGFLQNLGRVQEIFEAMEQDGHTPNALTYAILLDGYLTAGQYVLALQLYPKIEELVEGLQAVLKDESASALTEKDAALFAQRGQPVRHIAAIYAILLTCADEVQEKETIIRLMKDLVRLRIPLSTPRSLARAVSRVADSLQGSGVVLPREALARRVVDEGSRDPADWLEIENQYQFMKSVPNMEPQWEIGASQRASATLRRELGVSFMGNPRTTTRKAAARWWRHGAGNKGMKPALFSPHILSKTVDDLAQELSAASTGSSSSSSSSGSSSAGADQVVRDKGRRVTGRRLFYACLRESPLSPTHSHAAVEDHYLETLHSRPLTALTLRPSEQVVALLGEESRESLQGLFNRWGEPGAQGSPTYAFLSPWLLDPDPLCALLAARACHPESVLLLRHMEPDAMDRSGPPHIKRLLQRCNERKDMLLGSMLVSALEALPAGVLINNKTLIVNNPSARGANVRSFDRMLQGAVFGALPRDLHADDSAPSPARHWRDWLAENGLRQLVQFTDEEARIDSIREATGWNAQDAFRVRGCESGQVAVDFLDPNDESGRWTEYLAD